MKQTKRLRVLLVDDDAPLRRAVARVLSAFEVVHAGDGLEAVAALEHETYDVIVTDLEMPRMTGDELVGWLATNRPDLVSRVVIVTGGAKFLERQEWLDAFDSSRIVRKPSNPDDLIRAIERVAKEAS